MTQFENFPGVTTCQLGIVTKTKSEDYEVQIFKNGEGDEPNGIRWGRNGAVVGINTVLSPPPSIGEPPESYLEPG